MRETTALGSAIAAGLAAGIWRSVAELRDINRAGSTVFRPQISLEQSREQFAHWEKAVGMCRGWVGKKSEGEEQRGRQEITPRDQPQKVDLKKGMNGVIDKTTPTLKSLPSLSSKLNGDLVLSKAAPWINISGDLSDADDQDLFLELRKLEILQRLKRLGKVKVTYI